MALLQANFYSNCLCRQTTFNAIVPVGKQHEPNAPKREKKPFKTLYLLHGLTGNYMDWLSCSRIAYWAENRNLAVIMPSADNSFYVNNENALAMYGEYFGRELVEITRELFPLSEKREDTFIAGLSMGGYGAIRTGLKYHETFGAIAGLSSAFMVEEAVSSTNDTPTIVGRRSYFESVFGDLNNLIGSDKDPKELARALKSSGAVIPSIYLCCGTEDFLIEHNRDFHNFLRKQNVAHTYVEGAGAHTWEFWDEYILKILDWLPLEKQ
jgi:S-formylglutathione hydrolase FrmB